MSATNIRVQDQMGDHKGYLLATYKEEGDIVHLEFSPGYATQEEAFGALVQAIHDGRLRGGFVLHIEKIVTERRKGERI